MILAMWKWLLLFLFISSRAYACVNFLSEDYQFINENGKTVGIRARGVMGNGCNYNVHSIKLSLTVFDFNNVPRHVFKHRIYESLAPGEVQEYDFTNKLDYDLNWADMQAQWNQ